MTMTARHVALLVLLIACAVLVVGQLYVAIPLTEGLADRFAVPHTAATLVGTAFGLAYAAGFLVLGLVADRLGRRRVLVAGLLATAIATVLVGLAQTYELALAARALQGFVAAAFPPTAFSVLAEDLPPRHRPLGVSLISLAFLGAAPLAQMVGVAFAPLGFETLMLILAPAYAVCALGLAVTVTGPKTADPAPARAPGSAQPSVGASLATLAQDRQVLAAWASAVTVLFGFVSFFAGIAALAPTPAGGWASDPATLRLVTLPPLLLTLVAAPLSRCAGPALPAVIGLGVAALGLAVSSLSLPGAVPVGAVILAGGMAMASPGLIGIVASRADTGNRAFAMAIYSFVLFVGAGLAPPMAQALAVYGLAAVVLPSAVLMALAALILAWARAPRPVPATCPTPSGPC